VGHCAAAACAVIATTQRHSLNALDSHHDDSHPARGIRRLKAGFDRARPNLSASMDLQPRGPSTPAGTASVLLSPCGDFERRIARSKQARDTTK
jgi:hypothetical protein